MKNNYNINMYMKKILNYLLIAATVCGLSFAVTSCKDGAVFFNATVLKEQLQKEGFEFSSVSQAWAKKGYIRKAKDGRNTHGTFVNGIKARYVAIVLPEVTEDDEEDYDGIVI